MAGLAGVWLPSVTMVAMALGTWIGAGVCRDVMGSWGVRTGTGLTGQASGCQDRQWADRTGTGVTGRAPCWEDRLCDDRTGTEIRGQALK